MGDLGEVVRNEEGLMEFLRVLRVSPLNDDRLGITLEREEADYVLDTCDDKGNSPRLVRWDKDGVKIKRIYYGEVGNPHNGVELTFEEYVEMGKPNALRFELIGRYWRARNNGVEWVEGDGVYGE